MNADRIYKNGKFYTVDPDFSVAEAVVVKDGRFAYVGKTDEAMAFAGDGTEVIDLEGKVVLPGLIDQHVHVPGSGYNVLYNCNVYDAHTAEEINEMMAKHIAENPNKEFYYGRGFKPAIFPQAETTKGPRKERLDALCKDKPVMLVDEGGHEIWMNTKAFEWAGITKDTICPEGGIIEKNEETGELWGILKENAKELVPEIQYTPEQKKEAFKWFQDFFSSLGYTSVGSERQPICTDPVPILETMHEFEEEGNLNLHISAAREIKVGGDVIAQLDHLEQLRETYSKISKEIIIPTAKYFLDGTVESASGFLLEPYAEGAGMGEEFCSESPWDHERLLKAFDETMKRGFNVHIHAIGDGAVRYAADAIEYGQARNPREHRNCITHLQLVAPEDKERLGKLGVVACVNSYWHYKDPLNYYDGELKNLGEERAEKEYPVKSLMDAGCIITCASDHPVTPEPSAFMAMQAGVTRNIYDAEYAGIDELTDMDDPYGLLGKEERVSLEDMVKAFTINAAYALYLDDVTGSIEEGKWADMAIINQDIFEIDPLELGKTQVLETIFEGKTVFKV